MPRFFYGIVGTILVQKIARGGAKIAKKGTKIFARFARIFFCATRKFFFVPFLKIFCTFFVTFMYLKNLAPPPEENPKSAPVHDQVIL